MLNPIYKQNNSNYSEGEEYENDKPISLTDIIIWKILNITVISLNFNDVCILYLLNYLIIFR